MQRCQFPLILGWAMTPWKAQGMTLDRAIVRLTRAAASPGVAFVALSRVRHPDHLMLEDTFPDLATIMRQSDKESFQARQRWERRMRAHFSRTVRAHMQDADMYSPQKVWDAAENEILELSLATLRKEPEAEKAAVVQKCLSTAKPHAVSKIQNVWEKLHTFPHIFEVAEATGTLMEYDLTGKHRASTKQLCSM